MLCVCCLLAFFYYRIYLWRSNQHISFSFCLFFSPDSVLKRSVLVVSFFLRSLFASHSQFGLGTYERVLPLRHTFGGVQLVFVCLCVCECVCVVFSYGRSQWLFDNLVHSIRSFDCCLLFAWLCWCGTVHTMCVFLSLCVCCFLISALCVTCVTFFSHFIHTTCIKSTP